MEADNFDTELFIDEIEKGKAIWDMESSEYSKRNLRRGAWEEIVEIFCDPSDADDKKNIRHFTIKKWKGLRDCFVREMKKQKTKPSGSAASNKVSYMYFQRLMFLERSVRNKLTETNIEDPSASQSPVALSVDGEDVRPPSEDRPTKKKKISAADGEFLRVIKKTIQSRSQPPPQTPSVECDDDKLFCISLHKELLKVPEQHRLQTKIEIMSVLQKAQQPSRLTQTFRNIHKASTVELFIQPRYTTQHEQYYSTPSTRTQQEHVEFHFENSQYDPTVPPSSSVPTRTGYTTAVPTRADGYYSPSSEQSQDSDCLQLFE